MISKSCRSKDRTRLGLAIPPELDQGLHVHYMKFIDILGLVAGLLTSASIVPQLVKTIRKKTASDVSVVMYIVLLAGTALWIYYGVEKSDVAIIATNALSLLLNIGMLVCKFVFKKNDKENE